MQRLSLPVGKEIVGRAMGLPVGTQFRQQARRQRHAAVLVALACADPEQSASAIDVSDAQMHDLAQT